MGNWFSAYDIEMVDPVGQILQECADGGHTQRSVALTYCFILRQEPQADWAKIDAAIAKRWPKGLKRVKELAWKYAMGAMPAPRVSGKETR